MVVVGEEIQHGGMDIDCSSRCWGFESWWRQGGGRVFLPFSG